MSITATAGAGSEGLNIHGRNDSNNNWNNLMTVRRSGNVGIGVADPQAILDLSSTTSGFLPPKMTNTQRNNIVNPPEGSVVYNTSADKLNYYNGASWKNFGGGGYCYTNHVWGDENTPCVCPEGWHKPDLGGDEELGVDYYCAWSHCLGGQVRPVGTVCEPGECSIPVGTACLCCHD
jgi:hypothetical protein|tara:strand:- start:2804 stop:3334 length:531 start_codon:yes stop_codon:yes gene_type:complete